MARRVCPWWMGYLLLSPVRRLVQDPRRIVAAYVAPGSTVLEPGPGMGYFTLELARQVGPGGRVVAMDVQERMLAALRRRAARAGLAERIETRLVAPGSLSTNDLAGAVDFVLAVAMVHEVPEPDRFFLEAASAMKGGSAMLLAEPSGHVDEAAFERELELARAAGLHVVERPRMWRSHSALLRK